MSINTIIKNSLVMFTQATHGRDQYSTLVPDDVGKKRGSRRASSALPRERNGPTVNPNPSTFRRASNQQRSTQTSAHGQGLEWSARTKVFQLSTSRPKTRQW